MHPVRLLLDFVPELLVERRPLSRPGHPAAGLSLADRQPRRGDGRTARQPRRPVPALSLPHHHELRADLPEGAQSRQGDRRNQEDDGGEKGLSFGWSLATIPNAAFLHTPLCPAGHLPRKGGDWLSIRLSLIFSAARLTD